MNDFEYRNALKFFSFILYAKKGCYNKTRENFSWKNSYIVQVEYMSHSFSNRAVFRLAHISNETDLYTGYQIEAWNILLTIPYIKFNLSPTSDHKIVSQMGSRHNIIKRSYKTLFSYFSNCQPHYNCYIEVLYVRCLFFSVLVKEIGRW